MATASAPLTFALATCAVVGTAVTPSSPIPDNCFAIVILNTGANAVLYGIAAPGAAALTEGTNAARINAGASLTIPIGSLSQRGIMDEVQLTGSGLVYSALVGATSLDITYQNALGSVGF